MNIKIKYWGFIAMIILGIACGEKEEEQTEALLDCSTHYCINRDFLSIETEIPIPPVLGYGIMAELTDLHGETIIDQSDFSYNWTIDDSTIGEISPYTGGDEYECTLGITPPCPYDHLLIKGKKKGDTIVRVEVIQNSTQKTIAETSWELIIK